MDVPRQTTSPTRSKLRQRQRPIAAALREEVFLCLFVCMCVRRVHAMCVHRFVYHIDTYIYIYISLSLSLSPSLSLSLSPYLSLSLSLALSRSLSSHGVLNT